MALQRDGFAAARLRADGQRTNALALAEGHTIDDPDEVGATLRALVREHELHGTACHVVLAGHHYKLVQTEQPAVPADELNEAVRWSIKDLIDFPVDQAVIDTFAQPAALVRGERRTINVVAARRETIQWAIDAVNGAGLELRSIDIPELALRNLASRAPSSDIGVGLVFQTARGVVVSLYQANELFLSRTLSRVADLTACTDEGAEGRERLLLELQRTLDYYDSQLKQRPPACLYLQPQVPDADGLIDYLRQNLACEVDMLRLDRVLALDEPIELEVQHRCFEAVAACLREEAA